MNKNQFFTFFKDILGIFIFCLFAPVGLFIFALPGLIVLIILSVITGDGVDNIFGIIVCIIASVLFYLKTNLGKQIIDYLSELFDM